MKRILLAFLLITAFGISGYQASELDVSKQEMMRSTPSEPSASQVVDMEQAPIEDKSMLAIVVTTVIIITVVGVSSLFITKFALSLRGKEDDIYISKESKDNENQDN